MSLPPAPTVAVLAGRVILVELAPGWALEVLALELVTIATILAEGREIARVHVSRC
jgi:hypothetical protein